MTLTARAVLQELESNGPARFDELSRTLRFPADMLSEALVWLEARGQVRRSAEYGRAHWCVPTSWPRRFDGVAR